MVIVTGTTLLLPGTTSVSGRRGSLSCGRALSGNTSSAMVPSSELALLKRLVATSSLSSLVIISRTMPRATTS